MSKFKVGDYVRVKKFKERPVGWAKDGTMDYLMGRIVLIIDVFETFKGTNTLLWICDEKSNTSHCVSTKWVEKENKAIAIYMKGNQVIALDKATGKKAVAKCHPDDEFDFNIGAKLAFERLIGVSKEEPKEEPKEEIKDFAKTMYEFRSNLEKAGFTKQESMDFVIKVSLKGMYPN